MSSVRDVQDKILYVMKYIHNLCEKNNIQYCIMGGTAIGAVRHKGFIPWDDDLDIFMTPENYTRFKDAITSEANDEFYLQEWKTCDKYLEYAKVRLNGTTFIEEAFVNNKDMHHGIYVDIMILHKCSEVEIVNQSIYFASKLVTLIGLSYRNWIPKSRMQRTLLAIIKLLPRKIISRLSYAYIYSFDKKVHRYKYSYFITKAKFHQGIFDRHLFEEFELVDFEDTKLFAPKRMEEYLTFRYGDYMKLPPLEQRENEVHAMYFDVDSDYTSFFEG